MVDIKTLQDKDFDLIEYLASNPSLSMPPALLLLN